MKRLFFMALALGMSSQAVAKNYGMAGCGLGSIVMGKNNQVLAATTNGSSYSRMFGITSGTSNCADHDRKVALAPYIEINRNQILNEIAQGRGESLAGLGTLMGCQSDSNLGGYLQRNYAQISGEGASDWELTDRIYTTLAQEGLLKASCLMFRT